MGGNPLTYTLASGTQACHLLGYTSAVITQLDISEARILNYIGGCQSIMGPSQKGSL